MTDYDTILTAASRHSVRKRLDLIDARWQAVPEDSLPSLSDEQRLEIERRSKALDAGTVKTIPCHTGSPTELDSDHELRTMH